MPQFKYSGVGADGAAVKGVLDGTTAAGVENDLLIHGLSQVKVRERKSFTQIEITRERVPRQEIMHFARQLAAFVRTGIPISEAMRIVSDGVDNKRFKGILLAIEEDLQAGQPFAAAVARHAAIFPPYFVSILRSAELTGQLDVVLDQLSAYIERDLDARSKVKSALTYPAVIMVMSIVTMLVMVLFVLPRFVVFFDDLDAELPLPTRMLLGFAAFMGTWWWLLALIVAAFVATIMIMRRSERGQYALSRFLLRIPLIGTIIEYSTIERFCRVVSAMMRAGVPLPEAMASAIESANNKVFETGLVEVREAMIQGDGIAGPLGASGLFPNAAVQMFRVGEETGTLDQQAASAGEFYARELEFKLKRLTTLFEPAVILFMGFVVGFVAVALISAMYGVFQGSEKLK